MILNVFPFQYYLNVYLTVIFLPFLASGSDYLEHEMSTLWCMIDKKPEAISTISAYDIERA